MDSIPVTYALNEGQYNRDGGFDGDGGMILLFLIFVLALGGGNGLFGGNNGTLNTLTNDFLFTNLNSGQMGISNQITATNQGICSSTYELARTMDGLSRQMSDCCCTTQRSIDALGTRMDSGFCDIKTTMINLDSQEQIRRLERENQALSFQLSQNAQTRSIIEALKSPTTNTTI